MNKKVTILLASIAAFVIVCFFALRQFDGSSDDSFRVAVNIPLTGPIANSGALFRDSAQMAIDELSKSGLLRDVEMDWYDNSGSPTTTASLAQRSLLTSPALHFIGYDTRAALPALDGDLTPVFSFSFLPTITNDPKVFRNSISYKLEYPVMLKFIKQKSPKKLAAVFLDIPESQEEFQSFVVPELKSAGWSDDNFLLIPYSVMETDFRSIAAKIKAFGPDLVVLNGFQITLAPLVEALHAQDLVAEGNILATFDLNDVPALLDPQLLDGIAFTIPDYLLSPSGKTAEFMKRYETRFGRKATYSDFTGYDFVLIANEIANATKGNVSPQTVSKAIQGMQIEGVSGVITFDAEGDAKIPITIGVFRDGMVTPFESVR